MEMFYQRSAEETISYTLICDPIESLYWSTKKLKKSEIKLLKKFNKQDAATIKQEILDDINSTELGK